MTGNYFLQMIQQLRQQEEILLYGNILHIHAEEVADVADFLEQEYRRESLGYPYTAPAYQPEAASWAARTVYLIAQLILYREDQTEELETYFPAYTGYMDAGAILSADLCLRFLPDMLIQLELIDTQDELINRLQQLLATWHYSAVSATLETAPENLEAVAANPCLHQLYADRIIACKKISLAQHPTFRDRIGASLGMYGPVFWNEFKTVSKLHEEH